MREFDVATGGDPRVEAEVAHGTVEAVSSPRLLFFAVQGLPECDIEDEASAAVFSDFSDPVRRN